MAHSGDSPLWLALAVAALLWGGPFCKVAGLRVLIATLAGGAMAGLLKLLFRRRRPAEKPSAWLYGQMDRHSFPSGHATRCGCMVVVLTPLLPAWGAVGLVAWAGLVALARVSLRVHYLLDVVVGLLLGGVIGAVLLTLL